jgi:hypothetical protein
MRASKGRQGPDAANEVQVLMQVYRLPHVQSDVVITLWTPASISERSSSAIEAGSGTKVLHLSAPTLFRLIVDSFRVNDWKLFGES